MENCGRARQATDGNVILCMRFAYRITKAMIHTHSEYVIFITFRRQQWLRERSLMLRYTYIAFRGQPVISILMWNNGNVRTQPTYMRTVTAHL